MGEKQTIAFIDLAGSTGIFESVGNERAAELIVQITQWIQRVTLAHNGKVIKYLGDGVLTQFEYASDALAAVVFLQRNHSDRLLKWPPHLRMGLQIGMASGDVIDVGHDTLGDAFNLASRLSGMAGANAIWATESVIAELRESRSSDFCDSRANSLVFDGVRFRSLGQVRVRGLVQPPVVFQIEWQENISTELMTVRSALSVEENPQDSSSAAVSELRLQLSWRGASRTFKRSQLPLIIGRLPSSDFVVGDQRVSRLHAQVDCVDGNLVLTDVSSFGTWVRFADNPSAEIQLRRTHCVLHAAGDLALGSPFADVSVPTVGFDIQRAQRA